MNKLTKTSDLKTELLFLYKVAQTVHSLELAELLNEIVNIAIEVTNGESCFIYLLDLKKNELVLKASKNPHKGLLDKIKMRLGEGITGWVAKEKIPVVISAGAYKDSRFKYFRSLPEDRFEAFLSVPITNKRGVVGVINIQHRQIHKHSDMEINLLQAIGKLVGGAVENAILIKESLELKDALQIRKYVERAKGILMTRKNCSEEDAFRSIQKESMNSRKSIREIAEAIILADGIKIIP